MGSAARARDERNSLEIEEPFQLVLLCDPAPCSRVPPETRSISLDGERAHAHEDDRDEPRNGDRRDDCPDRRRPAQKDEAEGVNGEVEREDGGSHVLRQASSTFKSRADRLVRDQGIRAYSDL